MSIILSGLIHLFRPLLSSLSGALDCQGLGPWYFLLGLRIIAIFFGNGPWDKAKDDVACNWSKDEKSVAFCTAVCHNQHFAISVSATWGLVFMLSLLYVGLMRLSNPEEEKEGEKEKKKEGGGENLAVVASAPHGETADISTVYTVGRHGLPRDDEYGNDNYYGFPYHPYSHPRAHWRGHHMAYMGEGYGPIVPFGPYGTGGYGGEEYGMPGSGAYGMPGGGGYGLPGTGGYGLPGGGGYGLPGAGGYGMPGARGYGVPGEGDNMLPEGGHVMPDDEGRSVPAVEGCGISANGGCSEPADGGYLMPSHAGHTVKSKTLGQSYNPAPHKLGVSPMNNRPTKLTAHPQDIAPLPGHIKQTKAASCGDETERSRAPTKTLSVPINSSPYKNKYQMATKCRPVIESDMDSRGNAFRPRMDDMALKHRQVHRSNRPTQRPRDFGMDSNMAAKGGPIGGGRRTPGSAGPPSSGCCDDAACPCAENASCHGHSAADGEPPRQPSGGAASSRTKPSDSGRGSQEKPTRTITNLCGVPLVDIWVGLLLATEISFLCVILVLQMPSLLSRSWVCYPAVATCPPSVECVVKGRAEKRVALWGLVLTCILFIIACSGYFYVRTCSNRGCCRCCGEEARENQGESATDVEPEGRVMRGDVEGGRR